MLALWTWLLSWTNRRLYDIILSDHLEHTPKTEAKRLKLKSD